jgi:hypothetical protein
LIKSLLFEREREEDENEEGGEKGEQEEETERSEEKEVQKVGEKYRGQVEWRYLLGSEIVMGDAEGQGRRRTWSIELCEL